MKQHPPDNQLTIYYNPDHRLSNNTLAYARSEGISVREVDVTKTPIPLTELVQLADKLGMSLEELAAKDSPAFERKYNDNKNLSNEDWIKIIHEDQRILRLPIAIRGDHATIVNSPADIQHL